MSTRIVSTRARRLPILLGVFLVGICGGGSDGPVSLQAQERSRTFGGRHGWDVLRDFSNAEFAPGWQGGNDVVLTDAARIAKSDTDLLATFDGTFADQVGNYRVIINGVVETQHLRRFGSGAAAFDGTGTLSYLPGPEALFAPGTQPPSFTVDFWMYPAYITEGAVILRRRGALLNGDRPVLQDFRLEIDDRRPQWVLNNVVVRADNGSIDVVDTVRLSARGTLVPQRWQHHQLRYDARTGQLAYLRDGVPEDIVYLSDTGEEGGRRTSILFGADTGDGIVLGNGFVGALDEMRISRSRMEGPQPANYGGEPGRVLSEPIDLGGSSALLQEIRTRVHTPGNTEVRGYYRVGNTVVSDDTREALREDWRTIPSSGEIPGNVRGRFLQVRYDLLADARRQESPRLQETTIRYRESTPTSPPRSVSGRAVPGGVELSWDEVLQPEIAGYRVYFGERPGRYIGAAGVASPRDAGDVRSVTITGLEADTPYVFAVRSYDRYGQVSALSREVEVRAGREAPE